MAYSTDHSKAVLENEGISGSILGASRADRAVSFSSADFPRPSGAEEEWRFTPMKRVAEFLAADYSAGQANVEAAEGWQEVSREDTRLGTIAAPDDRSAALAWESFTRAHVYTLSADAEAETVLSVKAQEGMSSEHILVIAEPHARGTIVIEHSGSADLNEGVEVLIGEGAEVTVVSVQEAERTARHFSSQHIRVGRDAKVRHIVVTLGGDVVRISTRVDYEGPGGEVELLGAYITDAGEHQEHRVFVHHNEPNCVSRVTYKGALQGDDAHSVWIGDVLIAAQATGTDSYELNRNLVLTKGAKADSVPNLEIETGEIVGAGHASATGRFDEEQLFYLQARGIPEDVARRLVVRGFFAELVEQIGVASIQKKLMDAIERELDLAGMASTTAYDSFSEEE